MTDQTIAGSVRNRFDRMEIAGAFGDLGTLIPFISAYIGILKMDVGPVKPVTKGAYPTAPQDRGGWRAA